MSPKNKMPWPLTAREVLLPPGLGAALFIAVFVFRQGLNASDREAFQGALCDGLTVPGVILTGLGLLRWVSDLGAFDGLSFGVRKAFGQVLREERRNRMPKTYYDFVSAREKKPRKSSRMLLITGGLFLAGAGIVLGIYLSI